MSKILTAIRNAISAGVKSRYRLWQETGVDQGQLSRLMKGESGMGVDKAEKLADALNLEITIKEKKGEGTK
jgi:hypothetical protein